MYPTLATVFGIPLTSYYILWTLALCIGVLWTQRRAVRNFGVDIDAVSSVITWSFVAMLVGARIGGYFDNWSFYAAHPERIWMFWEGGLSSTPAFLGAGIAGILLCRKNDIPVWKLADAASIPAAATYVVGRVGCFLNGCCAGFQTSCPSGVHFPSDPHGVFRHPTQLYYSAISVGIVADLFLVERRMRRSGRPQGAVLWPIFMVLFGAMRLGVDMLREGDRFFGLRVGQIVGGGVLVVGLLWLAHTLLRRNAPERDAGE